MGTTDGVEEAKVAAKEAAWKCAVADRLPREANASHAWIAQALFMEKVDSVRVYLSQR